MLIAHGPIAAISSYFFLKKEVSGFKHFEKIIFFVSTFLLGILPDFDIFYLVSKGQPAFLHHSIATHTPAFWISIGFIILLTTYILKVDKKHVKIIMVAFLASTISHTLSDAIAGHIMLFTPIYNQYFTLIGNWVPDSLFGGYLKNPMFAFELIICAIFIHQIAKEFFHINLKLLVGFSILYLIFNTLIYTQVYQIDLYQKIDGNPVIDTDRDGLADTYDYDYDNNFVNNFNQVPKSQLLDEFEKVTKHASLLPSENRTYAQDVLYSYGKHDLIRAILQAYAQTGNYLPPVIHDYMRQNSITKFSDGIVGFLLATERIKEIRQPIPGSLAMAKYGDNYAIGIVLRDGRILIENEKGYPMIFTMEQAMRFGIRFLD